VSSTIEHNDPLAALADDPDRYGSDTRTVLTRFYSIIANDPSYSRAEIYMAGEQLLAWRDNKKIEGLWSRPPIMLTATIDDAIGQGLRIIHLFSRLAGIDIREQGLMRSPETIVEQCCIQKPDLLGMTILQFLSEEVLCDIVDSIPSRIRVIVGGPIFKSFSRKELESKNYQVLNEIREYIDLLLNFG